MKSFAILILSIFSVPLFGQYTINQSSGKIKIIEINSLSIQGSSGSEIVIEIEGDEDPTPERAKGLKLLSPSGLEDNTGIGLSVTKDGNVTEISAISSRSDQHYTISVPAGVSVYYECNTHAGEAIEVKDLTSELEVSVNFNDINISNAKGPLAISTVHGSIDASFEQVDQSNAISLHSVHNHVDVTVPAATKANFMLSTSWGEIFTDLELDLGEEKDKMKKISSHHVDGKLNGGGVDFAITSTHDNIYLRKK